jgi:predicted GNAT family N-acyltransferase
MQPAPADLQERAAYAIYFFRVDCFVYKTVCHGSQKNVDRAAAVV